MKRGKPEYHQFDYSFTCSPVTSKGRILYWTKQNDLSTCLTCTWVGRPFTLHAVSVDKHNIPVDSALPLSLLLPPWSMPAYRSDDSFAITNPISQVIAAALWICYELICDLTCFKPSHAKFSKNSGITVGGVGRTGNVARLILV